MAFVRFKVPDADNDYAGTGIGRPRHVDRVNAIIRARKVLKLSRPEISRRLGESRQYVHVVLKREGIK